MYAAVQLQLSGHDVSSEDAQSSLANILGGGPSAPPGAGRVEVAPPAAGDDVESDGEGSSEREEDDDRPLTRDELKIKTLRNLAKREGRAAPPDAAGGGGAAGLGRPGGKRAAR